ncbi:amino acid transporter [Acinetobacter sp. LoGeW2-3]|uniref:LysE family translocator n=1 Tax=Acinetobacter sp. LoGeW2-3 TaxID=1808001 RepID=UPI000C059A5D|nr:LysE family translocator [Acinetobacter sp. LoGeW2-3]ATO19809.1 amino acid transporter [Acinetobacter sp. LoGeW2-3]
MNITEYLLYCLAVVIMIATPGPVMLLVASAGLKGGYKHALQTIFGTNFASLVLIALSILSLKGLLVVNENWLNSIKLLGCLYITWLGIQIFREVWQGQGVTGPQRLQPVQGGFRTGFLVGISNPKDIIFFAAFFPQFIGISPNLDLSLVILTTSWIILDFLTLSLVYLGFQRLSRSQIYPHLLGLCGLILLLVALYGIYSVLI